MTCSIILCFLINFVSLVCTPHPQLLGPPMSAVNFFEPSAHSWHWDLFLKKKKKFWLPSPFPCYLSFTFFLYDSSMSNIEYFYLWLCLFKKDTLALDIILVCILSNGILESLRTQTQLRRDSFKMWFASVTCEGKFFHLALTRVLSNSFSSAFLEPLKALRGAPRGRDLPQPGREFWVQGNHGVLSILCKASTVLRPSHAHLVPWICKALKQSVLPVRTMGPCWDIRAGPTSLVHRYC